MRSVRETDGKTNTAPLQDFTSPPGDEGIMLHKPRAHKNHISSGILQNQEIGVFPHVTV